MIPIKTTSQVAKLAGISIRTLQYYDEIGLLKPSGLTPSGYRLYDEEALQLLQQILFFKELGFKLRDIREMLVNPDFDRTTAFKKQKELLLLKRNRTDRLIQLLDRLEKGETCMSFKEFDLSDYISALEDFKNHNTNEVVKYWGSVANYDLFIQKIKEDESHVAKLAIKQFGSVEKYTEAMKENLAHFSELMEQSYADVPEEIKQNDLFQKCAEACRQSEKGSASGEAQHIVREIIAFAQGNAPSEFVDDPSNYCRLIMDIYSNDYQKTIFDSKNGSGSADSIVAAFRCYLEQSRPAG